MIDAKELKKIFDAKAREAGYLKKGSEWRVRKEGVLVILHLQRSMYDNQFFVNLAFHLMSLDPVEPAKEVNCHIRCRADSVLPHQEPTVLEILHGAGGFPAEKHAWLLGDLFRKIIDAVEALSSEQALVRELAAGRLESCIIFREAKEFLAALPLGVSRPPCPP